MESCQYETINSDCKNKRYTYNKKPFVKQMFISSCVWAQFFTIGLWHGTPTVIIPQLRNEANSTAVISEEMESWISSVIGYAALPWAIMFPLCIRSWGRKLPFIFAGISSLTSFIICYCSSTPMQILAGEIVAGIIYASNLTVAVLVITEYTSPQYRGIFLTIKSASMNIAILIANAIGTFFHWKYIPILGFVCSVYSLASIFWPESPYWLASKGKFEECAISHRWLKGISEESERELQNLLDSQKVHRKNYSERQRAFGWSSVKNLFTKISSKQFYKPTLLSMLTVAIYDLSGKMVCVIYATQMIKKISDSEYTAYTGMLILDGITVFGMYVGCVLAKILNRRTLLFSASLCGASFLFILSLYLYLVKLSVVEQNKIVSLFLLTAFSLSISIGPLIMATSLYAELIPLRYKTLSVIFIILFCGLLQGTLLKLSPDLFKNCGMHGTFLFFGICFTVCIYLLYEFLPETKDKTLQEIEECFKDDYHNIQELKQLNT